MMSQDTSGPVTSSVGGSTSLRVPPPTNGQKRTHAVALDDDSDDETTEVSQTITHYSKTTGGVDAARPKETKGPLVIAPTANKRWQDARQDGRHNGQQNARPAIPERSTAAAEAQEAEAIRNRPKHGLNILKSTDSVDDAAHSDEEVTPDVPAPEPERKKTLDEIALDRLKGVQETSTLAIPILTESEAFARDYRSAPDQASAADYAAVPVEEFGAALLRGMGWKEGMGIGNQKGKKIVEAKFAERRAPLLGIGAKRDVKAAVELGTWGHGARRNRDKEGGGYNPVILRNRNTGQELTEEEMAARVKAQKEGPSRDGERSSWKHEDGVDRRERRRSRDRDGDRDRDRNRDRDRDRRDEYRSSRRDRSRDRYRDDRQNRHDDRDRDRDRERRRRDRDDNDDRHDDRHRR